ncbi:AAA family ATPase [Streptomyces sp. NPDC088387]|uniref:helix-turn-helix transcriptional regulator n=1 Tax=Streptomyces sp. NPDC088387 TaxID=3365859 RepID=UPI0038024964
MALVTRKLPLGVAPAPGAAGRGTGTGSLALLDALSSQLDAARRGEGSVVVVSSAPGLGKSVLLDSFTERAERQGVLTAGAVTDPHPAALRVCDQLTQALGRPPTADGDDPHRLGREAAELLLETARRQPLVIAVDDAQFIDATSAAVLLQVARRARGVRLLMILTRRDTVETEAAEFWTGLLGQLHTHDLRLNPLGRAAVRSILERGTGREAPAPAVDELLAASGGNPLLLAGLVDDLRAHDATATPGPAAGWPAPAIAYRRAARTLLHRGGPALRRAAQGLAVIGDPQHVEELTGLAAGSGQHALALLHRSGLWHHDRFVHPAARAAVLEDLDPRERNELFLRAVRIGQNAGRSAKDLAAHIAAAGPPRPPWTAALLESAAAAHATDGERTRAAELLTLARDIATDPGETDRLTCALIRVRWPGDPALAAQHITELSSAPALAGSDALLLARTLAWLGRPERARVFLAGTDPAVLRADHRATEEAEFTQHWLHTTYPALRDTFAVPPDGWGAPAFTPIQQGRRIDAIRALHDVLRQNCAVDAATEAARLLAGLPPKGALSPGDTFEAAEPALLALVYTEGTGLAAQHVDGLLDRVPPGAEPALRARLLALRAEIAVRRGDLRAASHDARHALELLAPASWGIALGQPVGALILALTARGRRQEALALLDVPLAAVAGSRYSLTYLQARARLHAEQGDLARALSDYQAVQSLATSWNLDAPGLADWRNGLAEALLGAGERTRARALVEEQLARFSLEVSPRAHGTALRLLAATEPPQARAALLRQSAFVLRRHHHHHELAQALTDLTEVYAATGESRRAHAVGRQGRAVAESCDAAPLLDRLRHVLEPAVPQDVPGTLSRAERRVAELAAMGDTNLEIAERLFVTVSTVEQHLTRVYRKLKVSGRGELAARLTDAGEPAGRRPLAPVAPGDQ